MSKRISRKREKANSHICLSTIKRYLVDGTYPNGSSTVDKRSVRKRAESFKIDDGELYYIARPKLLDGETPDSNPEANNVIYRKAVFTQRDQLTLTARIHVDAKGTHMGTERTLHALTSKYYWVGMSATVRKVLKSCAVCLANRPALSYHLASVDSEFNQDLHLTGTDSSVQGGSVENITENAQEAKTEMGDEDLSYEVTQKLENPEASDPNFDFNTMFVIREDEALMTASETLNAQRFWERVEILIVDVPDQSEREKMSHIIVALDSFSKWPEAMKLKAVNEKTVSQFVIQLISRYGVMEQLVMLENDSQWESYFVYGSITENLNTFGISVVSEIKNPYDVSWMRICQHLERFVQQHSENWAHCLDLCLMPLRMSVTSKADYSPAYILMGRDPKFPSIVIPQRDSIQRELMLDQEQLQTTAATIMKEFMECSIPDVKRVPLSSGTVPVNMIDTTEEEQSTGIRRSSRKTKKFHRLAGFDADNRSKNNDEETGNASDSTGMITNGIKLKDNKGFGTQFRTKTKYMIFRV